MIADIRKAVQSIGVTEVARRSGMSYGGVHNAISKDGNPRLSTVLALIKATDLKLIATVEPDPRIKPKRRREKVIACWIIPGKRLPVTREMQRSKVQAFTEMYARTYPGTKLYAICRLKGSTQ